LSARFTNLDRLLRRCDLARSLHKLRYIARNQKTFLIGKERFLDARKIALGLSAGVSDAISRVFV
jgi:hypothetical protein